MKIKEFFVRSLEMNCRFLSGPLYIPLIKDSTPRSIFTVSLQKPSSAACTIPGKSRAASACPHERRPGSIGAVRRPRSYARGLFRGLAGMDKSVHFCVNHGYRVLQFLFCVEHRPEREQDPVVAGV